MAYICGQNTVGGILNDTDITKFGAHTELLDLRDELLIVLDQEDAVMGIYALLELAAIRSIECGIEKQIAIDAFGKIYQAWKG